MKRVKIFAVHELKQNFTLKNILKIKRRERPQRKLILYVAHRAGVIPRFVTTDLNVSFKYLCTYYKFQFVLPSFKKV